MKKNLFIALLASFFVTTPTFASTFYLADDDITIDNIIDEPAWSDHKVISDKAETNNETKFCWNTAIMDWDEMTTESATCSTYLYDPLGQIDLLNAWFGVNETNMILAFETAVPMFSIQNMTTGKDISVQDYEALSTAGITELPAPFEHDMVFAFDANPKTGEAATYDWYMVANIDYDLSATGSEQDPNFLQIVKESGDTNGFQADEDEVVDVLDTTQSETANTMSTTTVMEISQNVEHFYEVTGLTAGDEVNFRLETHSKVGDTTKPVRLIFVDSNTITEDAMVVGSGATAFVGRKAKDFGTATVTAYTLDDQTIQLQFEAYDKKVGVQVAVGDVTGDGENEIVTLPLRSTPKPEWKVFSKTGSLVTSGTIAKDNDFKRLKKYHLAVGDVDGNGVDEIVFSNASGNRLLLDVFTLGEGELSRVDQYDATDLTGYAAGAWVEVANIDQSEDGAEEIITAPVKGSAVLDVFSVNNGVITPDFTYALEQSDFAGGVHIAATAGAVLVAKHSVDGDLQLLTWDAANATLTTGPMDTMSADTTLGKIGDLAWLNSGNYAYSSFEGKTVVYHSYNPQNGDEDTVTTDVTSRASFVDFFTVE